MTPKLNIGDLVTHRKKRHLGTGRVRRVTEVDTSEGDIQRVLVEWECGIADLDDPIRWRVPGGAEHLFSNTDARRGIHWVTDLDKLDLITAIGGLST